jgi:hypothetical protein
VAEEAGGGWEQQRVLLNKHQEEEEEEREREIEVLLTITN